MPNHITKPLLCSPRVGLHAPRGYRKSQRKKKPFKNSSFPISNCNTLELGPTLDTVFQLWPSKNWVGKNNPLPWLAGCTLADNFPRTLLLATAHSAGLYPFCCPPVFLDLLQQSFGASPKSIRPHPVQLFGIILCQVQNFKLLFVKLHVILVGQTFHSAEFCSYGSPSLCCINLSSQHSMICKFDECMYNPIMQIVCEDT